MSIRGIPYHTSKERLDRERTFLRDKIAEITGLSEEERSALEREVWRVAHNAKECRRRGLAPKESYFCRLKYNFPKEATRLVEVLTSYIRTHEFRYDRL